MSLSDPRTSCRQTRHRGRDPRPMRVSHVTRITFPTCRLHYPDEPDGCRRWLLPRRCKPSPYFRRVGVRHSPFGACSEFTHVTARWVARPPEAAFVAGLRSSRSPDPTARQLPDLTNNCLRGSFLHWRSAPSWRTKAVRLQDLALPEEVMNADSSPTVRCAPCLTESNGVSCASAKPQMAAVGSLTIRPGPAAGGLA
jgi:hypothetical protein